MKTQLTRNSLRCLAAGVALALYTPFTAHADVVEVTDGSVIQGKVLSTEGGVVKLETDFAGVIEIKQAQVKTLTTSAPVFVQLTDGNVVQGRIEKAGDSLRVAGTTGAMQTQPASIAHIWLPGDKSPADREVDALRRHWAYNAAIDLNGKSGNSDRFYLGMTASAVLKGPDDRLAFLAQVGQAEENGNTTQDDAKAIVDYSNNLSSKMFWYVNTELGFDRVKEIEMRSKSAVGIGYNWIKKAQQTLDLRGGLSYRFENYTDDTSFKSVGLDLGLIHYYNFGWGEMNNVLNYTPSFEDFGNFVVFHRSTLDLPIKSGESWKLRLGLQNDYTSEPPGDLDEMDTTYFTSLVFSWQ